MMRPLNVTTITLIVLTLNVQTSIAQKNNFFYEGAIHLKSQDVIHGLLEEVGGIKKRDQINVIVGEGEARSIAFEEIESIQYSDGLKYQMVDIQNEKTLTQVLVEGQQKLLYKRQKRAQNYYLINDDYTLIVSENSNKDPNERLKVVRIIHDDQKVSPELEKCSKATKGYKMNSKFLTRKAIQINKCLGSESIKYPAQRVIEEFAIVGGRSLINIENFENPYTMGLLYNRLLSNRKFSFQFKVHYFSEEREGITGRYVPIFAGLRYKFAYGLLQPYAYLGSGILLAKDNIPFHRGFRLVPIDIGLGTDVALSNRVSLKAEISFGSLFAPSLGIMYRMKRLK